MLCNKGTSSAVGRVDRAWRRWVLSGLAVLGLLLSALVACYEPAPPEELVSQKHALAAMVGIAQSYHAQADIAAERGDLVGAGEAMRALINELAGYPEEHRERIELSLDAHGRLARILMEQGENEAALDVIDEGLSFAGEAAAESLFAGYLLQARGDALRAIGDDRGAVQAHKDAILIFKALLDSAR